MDFKRVPMFKLYYMRIGKSYMCVCVIQSYEFPLSFPKGFQAFQLIVETVAATNTKTSVSVYNTLQIFELSRRIVTTFKHTTV